MIDRLVDDKPGRVLLLYDCPPPQPLVVLVRMEVGRCVVFGLAGVEALLSLLGQIILYRGGLFSPLHWLLQECVQRRSLSGILVTRVVQGDWLV